MNKFGQNTDQPAVYFNKLYMKNVRCFKGNHEIDLGNGKGEPSQWTVILGNNNVGKTTILRSISVFETKSLYKKEKDSKIKIPKNDDGFNRFDSYGMESNYISFNEELLFLGVQTLLSYKGNFTSNILNRDYKERDKDNILNTVKFVQDEVISTFLYTFKGKSFIMDGLEYVNPINLFGYGINRVMQKNQPIHNRNIEGLFDNKTLLLNVEEWLKELYFALTQEIKGANIRYKQVENILCGGLLPDVTKIQITTIPDKSSYETFPEFLTSQGWVRLEDLGYGYQATLAWVADLAKRMFDQYPDLENPLHGPAVVLVDEIDLHLHPEWQRKIIKYLSDLFPNTQFIVTAHSPLIIQSAENVNLIMLEKDDNPDGKGINIRQRFGSFQGWTVDEILTELMNLGDRTRSDLYLQLMQDFEEAVLNDNYEKAQNTYNQLDAILSPSSYQRKVLQIQMSSLIPVGV